MGILDSLFKKRSYIVNDPAELQTQLFDAVAAGKRGELRELCRANLDLIQQHFKGWSKVPEKDRTNPAMIQRYGKGLTSILECIQNDLGRGDIIPKLIELNDNNPLIRWRNRYAEANKLVQSVRIREAAILLTDVLIDVAKFKGEESFLAATYGLLGQCHFHSGATDDALPPLTKALDICEEVNDVEGKRLYLDTIFETQRYRGDSASAANMAERLSKFYGQTGNAPLSRRYAKIAAIVRAGEPLNRVVARIGNEAFEIDDAPSFSSGKVQFEYVRNRMELMPATRLNKDGGRSGSKGKLDEALDLFRAAAKADKYAPQAHYEAGTTLATLQRYPQAVESMAETDRLAPRWFNCRSDLWLMQQISVGKLPHEIYLAVRMLEDGPASPKEKVNFAEDILRREPNVARLNLECGKALYAVGRNTDATKAYRHGLNCVEDADTKSLLLLALAVITADKAEQKELFKQIVEIDGHLNATAMARVFLRN